MTAIRRTTLENEFLHWLVLLIAAIAILILLARASAGDPMGPPDERLAASASRVELTRPFFPEYPPLSAAAAIDAAQRLWMTFEHQRAGCYPDALAGWEAVPMPYETAVWKDIGMAAALLQADDLAGALKRLEAAEERAPHHPVVAYYRGLVWMRQAERLVGAPMEAERGTPAEERAVLQLMAIADFEEAIERADLVDPDEQLVTVPADSGLTAPRVRDLLAAAGAEGFAGDAHARLYALYRVRGELRSAGRHLESAVVAQAAAARDLREFAQFLLQEGDRVEAARLMWTVVGIEYPAFGRSCSRLQRWLQTQL